MARPRSRFGRGTRRCAMVGTLALVTSLACVASIGVPSHFARADARTAARATGTMANPANDAARGLQYRGLVREPNGPCGDHFRLQAATRQVICTHGPDPAPPGVDVTEASTTSDLLASGPSSTPTHAGSVQCIGDGVSGARVQAVYAVASDQPDRYAQVVPSIVTWAGATDGVFSQSAAESGGNRHVRFVTNPDCSLNVAHVVLSATGDDSFTNELTELQQRGFTRPLTKYLLWTDANVYCGIAQIVADDSASAANASNTNTEYARIDSGCWGRTDHLSEAHELMHTLGGVQASAPHGTPYGHCTDESDAMCYADGTGVALTYPCPVGHEWLFDCNDDDYWDTNPSPGSYLATHWNAARSQFLDDPNAAAPTTTTTTPRAATATATFSGSLSTKQPTRAFLLTVGTGTTSNALHYSVKGKTKSATALGLRVLAADRTVVASGSGPSVLTVVASLAAGTYTLEVSGSVSASFTLTVNYTGP